MPQAVNGGLGGSHHRWEGWGKGGRCCAGTCFGRGTCVLSGYSQGPALLRHSGRPLSHYRSRHLRSTRGGPGVRTSTQGSGGHGPALCSLSSDSPAHPLPEHRQGLRCALCDDPAGGHEVGAHSHQVSPTGTFLKSSKSILGSSFQPCREL